MSVIEFITAYWDWYLLVGVFISLSVTIADLSSADFRQSVAEGVFVAFVVFLFFVVFWPPLLPRGIGYLRR